MRGSKRPRRGAANDAADEFARVTTVFLTY